ncbi:Inositol-tetrakisphosphate 1-kinase [Chionoecetes opilio]|uniref:Inositol-tetrakisphosphate 1-kinase n=1 Tax=Chionoecetes opilio TaxID=41210 RepID=A0A8J8WBY3_CHIOP|nr:Inositol-tetrakisphosphate 1-kinase [Chionoecetes opilio]
MEQTSGKHKIVGYWFNEQKCQKFGVQDLNAECKLTYSLHPVLLTSPYPCSFSPHHTPVPSHLTIPLFLLTSPYPCSSYLHPSFTTTPIDMNTPLDAQGPFDLILHKVTALYAQALNNNHKAANALAMFEEYIVKHPETFIMDPLAGVHKLLLRNQTYELLLQRFKHDEKVFTPTYAELSPRNVEENADIVKRANVTFPVVCKPVTGGGGVEAHERGKRRVGARPPVKRAAVPCQLATTGRSPSLQRSGHYNRRRVGLKGCLALGNGTAFPFLPMAGCKYVPCRTKNIPEAPKIPQYYIFLRVSVCVCSAGLGRLTRVTSPMAVVFSEVGLSEFSVPCVAQSFINHGAVLYKLFVLGPVWFVIVRPSLKNFYAGGRYKGRLRPGDI